MWFFGMETSHLNLKPWTFRHKRSSSITQRVLIPAFSLVACDISFGLKFLLRHQFREWVTICHKSSSITAKPWGCRVVEWQSLHEISPGPTWKLQSESWRCLEKLDRNKQCILVGRNIAPTKISSQWYTCLKISASLRQHLSQQFKIF